jgi:hypothetical protein
MKTPNEKEDTAYSNYSPEKELWTAVLETAIDDFKKGRYAHELNLFFFGNGTNGEVFEWICQVLDINSDKFRQGLIGLKIGKQILDKTLETLSTERPVLE